MLLQIETAQLAKKMGFKNEGSFIFRRNKYSSQANPTYVIYATQYTLATWLRQVHNIHLSPEYLVSKSTGKRVWRFDAFDLVNLKRLNLGDIDEDHDKALEKGLMNTLKNLKEWTYNMKK